MGTLKKTNTPSGMNVFPLKSQINKNIFNPESSRIVDNTKTPIKSEHLDSNGSTTYPEYPFLFFDYVDISGIANESNNAKYDLSQQLLSAVAGVGVAPVTMSNDESSFRSTGTSMAALSFCSLIYGGEYTELAKTFFNTVISWNSWSQSGSNGVAQRDLGMSSMLFGSCISFDMLRNNLSQSEITSSLSKISYFAGLLEEAATSHYNSDWVNWWGSSYIQNHAITAYSALSLAALILRKENYSGWQNIYDTAINKMNRWKTVSNGIEDGTWCEGTSYNNTGYAQAIPAWEAMRKNDVNVTPEIHLQNYSKWRIYNHLSGSKQYLSSDGDVFWNNVNGRFMYVDWYIGKTYNNPYAQWFANKVWESSFSNNQDNRLYNIFLEYMFKDTSVAQTHPSSSYKKYSVFKDWEGVVWRDNFQNDWAFSARGGGYGGKYVQNTFATYRLNTYPWDETTPIAQTNWDHQHNDMGTFWIRKGNSDFVKERMGYDYPYISSICHNILHVDDVEHSRPADNDFESSNLTGSAGFMQDYCNNDYANYVNFNQTKRYIATQSISTASRYFIHFRDFNLITCIDHISSSATNERNYKIRTHLGYVPSTIQTNWYTASDGIGNVLGINFVNTSGSNLIYKDGLTTGEGGDNVYYVSCSKLRSASFINFVTNYYLTNTSSFVASYSSSVLLENENFIQYYIQSSSTNRLYVHQNFINSKSLITAGDFITDAQIAIMKKSGATPALTKGFFIHSGSELWHGNSGNTKFTWIQSSDQYNGLTVKYLTNSSEAVYAAATTASLYLSSSAHLPSQLYLSSSATYVMINDVEYTNFTIPSNKTLLINP